MSSPRTNTSAGSSRYRYPGPACAALQIWPETREVLFKSSHPSPARPQPPFHVTSPFASPYHQPDIALCNTFSQSISTRPRRRSFLAICNALAAFCTSLSSSGYVCQASTSVHGHRHRPVLSSGNRSHSYCAKGQGRPQEEESYEGVLPLPESPPDL